MFKQLNRITPPKDQDTVWRYMSFEKFVHILSENSLFFPRADMFDDPFEGFKPEPIKTIEKEAANQVKNDPEIETMEIFDGDTQEKFLENWP